MADDALELARDCLDSRVLDRNGDLLGRVDGIVLAIPVRGPPRVVAIEMGAVTQARRLSPGIGWVVAWLARRYGRARENPYRVAWGRLRTRKGNWYVDELEAAAAPPRAWERWLRDRFIGRIPGA